MICNSCGGPVQDNITICPYCGQPLTPQAPPPPPQFQQPPPQYQQAPYQQPYPQPVPPIDTHMVEAILVTLFCWWTILSLPCGIVSIVYASQVSSLVAAGNIQGAQQASRNAHTWAMIGLGIGLAAIIGYFIMMSVAV